MRADPGGGGGLVRAWLALPGSLGARQVPTPGRMSSTACGSNDVPAAAPPSGSWSPRSCAVPPLGVSRARPSLVPACGAALQDPAQVFADATEALAASVAKQQGKVAEAQTALVEAASESGSGAEKRREELATNLAQEQLLLGKQEAAAAAVAAGGAAAGVGQLLALAGDALAEALDKKLGATVTDPAIYRAHAAK